MQVYLHLWDCLIIFTYYTSNALFIIIWVGNSSYSSKHHMIHSIRTLLSVPVLKYHLLTKVRSIGSENCSLEASVDITRLIYKYFKA